MGCGDNAREIVDYSESVCSHGNRLYLGGIWAQITC